MSKSSLILGKGKWATKQDKVLAHAEGHLSKKVLARELGFSRADDIDATRVNSEGLIEKCRENFINYSNTFNATGWATAQASLFPGYAGYDGTSNAWYLQANEHVNTFARVSALYSLSTGIQATGLVTFSVYAKKKDYDYVGLYLTGDNVGVVFSLVTGEPVNRINGYPTFYTTGEDVGNGWWRFYVTHRVNTPTTHAGIYPCEGPAYDQNVNQNKGIYIQNAQFELGSCPTEYMGADSVKNFILKSDQIGTDPWAPSAGMTVTPGQPGYDGTNKAFKLSKSTATAERVSQNVDIPLSGVRTYSVYAKQGTMPGIIVRVDCVGVNREVQYNLKTGQQINIGDGVVSHGIENVGGNWWRIRMTVNEDVNTVRLYPANSSGSVSSGFGDIYVQHPQIEIGNSASAYVHSDAATGKSGVRSNEPRVDYRYGEPQLLIESSRHNRLKYSEHLGLWTNKSFMNVTDNAAISPEGFKNAALIVPTADDQSHYVDIDGFNRQENAWFVCSIYAKPAGYNIFRLSHAASRAQAVFELTGEGSLRYSASDGVNFSNEAADIEKLDNGWYRCKLRAKALNNEPSYMRISCSYETDISGTGAHAPSFEGDGVNGVYVYGAQCEIGIDVGSYMPTYGAACTRVNDVLGSVQDSTLKGITNDHNTTVFFDGDIENMRTLTRLITLTNTNGVDYEDPRVLLYATQPEPSSISPKNLLMLVQYRQDDGAAPDVVVDTSHWNSQGVYVNSDDRLRTIVRLDDTDLSLFVNGMHGETATVTKAEEITRLDLGHTGHEGSVGHLINSIQVFPWSLTNNDCEVLTHPDKADSFEDLSNSLKYES